MQCCRTRSYAQLKSKFLSRLQSLTVLLLDPKSIFHKIKNYMVEYKCCGSKTISPMYFILHTKEKHGSDPKGKEGKSFLCKHYDEKCREQFGVGRQNEM